MLIFERHYRVRDEHGRKVVVTWLTLRPADTMVGGSRLIGKLLDTDGIRPVEKLERGCDSWPYIERYVPELMVTLRPVPDVTYMRHAGGHGRLWIMAHSAAQAAKQAFNMGLRSYRRPLWDELRSLQLHERPQAA